jgi:hypothetical protein
MQHILKSAGLTALIFCLFLPAIWANLETAYQLAGSVGVRIGACLALDVMAVAALVAVVLQSR